MNDNRVFLNPCAICRKREATRLCDYIVVYDNHPIFMRSFKDFKEANKQENLYETCDLPLCPECAVNQANTDFCPDHWKHYQGVKLSPKLEKLRTQQKAKIMEEVFWREREKNIQRNQPLATDHSD